MRIHGCTVPFRHAEMDAGPIIAQAAVPVLPADDLDAPDGARASGPNSPLPPLALRLVIEGKVRMENGRAVHEYLTEDEGEASLFAPARNAISGPADIESLARFTP